MPKGGILPYSGLPAAAGTPGQVAITTSKALAPDALGALINPNSKATIGSMPTQAALGDIMTIGSDAYICVTPYTSGGTLADWEQVTDPRTMQLVAATLAAFSAAGIAQQSANGKNTITAAAAGGEPTSATPGVIGDTIFIISSAKIIAQYTLTALSGTTYTWTSVKVDSQQIANLDVGKITGAIAAFLAANITSLTSVYITSSTLASSDGSMVINLTNGTTYYYNTSGTQIAHGNAFGVTVDAGVRFKISPGLAVSGSQGLYVTDDATINGATRSATVYVTSPPTTTSSPNVGMTSDGQLVKATGSSRTLKHSIEPAEVDDDLEALDTLQLYAFHYFDDDEQRTMLAPMAEDMLADGLRRYVDFDNAGQPARPHYEQLVSLLIAGRQRDRRELADLKLTVAELQLTIARLNAPGSSS